MKAAETEASAVKLGSRPNSERISLSNPCRAQKQSGGATVENRDLPYISIGAGGGRETRKKLAPSLRLRSSRSSESKAQRSSRRPHLKPFEPEAFSLSRSVGRADTSEVGSPRMWTDAACEGSGSIPRAVYAGCDGEHRGVWSSCQPGEL